MMKDKFVVVATAIVLLLCIIYVVTTTHGSDYEWEEDCLDGFDEYEYFDLMEADDDEIAQDAFEVELDRRLDYLTLVNDSYRYEFGGYYDEVLQEDLVYVSDCFGEPTPIERATNLAFGMLKQALHEKGFEIELYSAYRSGEDQQYVFEYYGDLDGWAENNTVMPPGFSEHHTGLLVNYVIWWPDEANDYKLAWYTPTAERWAKNPEFLIIRDTLADYGFIERYPLDKEDVTGVDFEPYEIRFVGSSEIAHEIMDNDLCLEEYVGLD